MMLNYLENIKFKIKRFSRRKVFFTFIQNGPSVRTVWRSRNYLGEIESTQTKEFEKSFAKLIGNGSAVSFASGRMAFYSYLKVSGISLGDEVIIPGFTCSVMINAISRSGATPIFCDIDRETYGTSAKDIEKLITYKTKLIVAQHSFGKACDVRSIMSVAQKYNILVLEDCALTLGTSLHGDHVGNIGTVAIFSTDHLKPINTFVGGLLYSKNKEIIRRVEEIKKESPPLSLDKRKVIFRYFLLERLFARPKLYRFWAITQSVFLRYLYFKHRSTPFLNNDTSPQVTTGDYEYPSKYPEFLAYIGLQEIIKWPDKVELRRKHENELINTFLKNFSLTIPKMSDSTSLRLVFLDSDDSNITKRIAAFVDLESSWFKAPIINTNSQLEDFGYRIGDSKNAEFLANKIVNIPIPDSQKDLQTLIRMLERNVRLK
jgi:perosamine synthetase